MAYPATFPWTASPPAQIQLAVAVCAIAQIQVALSHYNLEKPAELQGFWDSIVQALSRCQT